MTREAGGDGFLDRVGARLAWSARRLMQALRRLGSVRAVGAIDLPARVAAGKFEITGWALVPSQRVLGVIVRVGGITVGLAELNQARPDVAAARPNSRGANISGWACPFDFSRHAGSHIDVEAFVATTSGLVDRLAVMVEVEGPETVAVISPAQGALIPPGLVELRGRALATRPIARIKLELDGRPVGRARLHAERTDDLVWTGFPVSGMASFSHVIDLRNYVSGTVLHVTGEAMDLDGNRMSLSEHELVLGEPRMTSDEEKARTERIRQRVTAMTADSVARDGERIHRQATSNATDVRLFVVTHDLGLGGGQLYLFELLRLLFADPEMTCLVIAPFDGPLRPRLEEMGADVHLVGSLYPVESPHDYELTLLELALVVQQHQCNVGLVNTAGAGIGADLANRIGLPVVWAIHESFELDEYFLAAYGSCDSSYVRERARAALRSAAAVVFEADATKSLYEHEGDSRRFVTVSYGISTAEVVEYEKRWTRMALRARYGLGDDQTVILCMGTFEPRKAQASLAIAFASLAAHFPRAVLIMVGDRAGDAYSEAVRDLATDLGLHDQIRVLPVLEDTFAWYRLSDVFVSASDLESMPRSIIEAMAFGLPVLAADVFGVSELITHGVNGYLCPARDVSALATGLRAVLEAEAPTRARIGRAARTRVMECFDSAGYVAAYRALIAGLVIRPDALPTELLAGLRTTSGEHSAPVSEDNARANRG